MMAHLCVSVCDHLQNRRSISRRKLAFYLCLQEFPGQTNHPECTSGNEGRREMGKQFSVETAVCTEHQRLLEGCQRALEIWNERPRFFRRTQHRVGAFGEHCRILQSSARAALDSRSREVLKLGIRRETARGLIEGDMLIIEIDARRLGYAERTHLKHRLSRAVVYHFHVEINAWLSLLVQPIA
jgi:hypothetical protein